MCKYFRESLPVLQIGDFDANFRKWWNHDITTTDGAQLDSLLTSLGLKQLIAEPTSILKNSSICIDLIFTNHPNIVLGSGVHSSLHPKCHLQIIHSKLNLKIEYPPPYTHEYWVITKLKLIFEKLKFVSWKEWAWTGGNFKPNNTKYVS